MLDQDTAHALLTIADETGAASRWSGTGTSSPRSDGVASWTTPLPGPTPPPSCRWTRCTGSPTPATPPSP
jgi:hypothetical protein